MMGWQRRTGQSAREQRGRTIVREVVTPMSPAVRRRGRALAALTATLGLVATVPALSGGAARSAEPAPDCASPYPIAQLAPDAPVRGLTVTKGTTPAPFTGTVVGVLENGIAPDLDMVVMRLSSPEIDRVGGIWAGMSGSPVYADDGRLIGAVAYGLAYGASPVAGITPFEAMDEYLDAAPAARIAVGRPLAERIAEHGDVTVRQAAQGFEQLPMALGVSGLSADRLRQMATADRDYLGRRDTYATGTRSGPGAPAPATVVAGGNIAAAVSYGDVTAAGVGTVTSVCRSRVVGFGHPMAFGGRTSLTLHPADALLIQEDPLGVPFKVANIGEPAGTITDDRLTGITGGFGALPETMTITSTVQSGSRERTGTTHVSVPSAGAQSTFSQHLANHDRVVDGLMPGRSYLDYAITGTDTDGSSFRIAFSDQYHSPYDITFDSGFDVADLVYGLTSIEGVTVDEVTMRAEVSPDKATYTVSALQQRRSGKWVTLGKGRPAVVRAGTTLSIRAVLTGAAGRATTTYNFAVPKKYRGERGHLSVTGGNSFWSEAAFQPTVDKIAAAVRAQVRNDATRAQLTVSGGRRGLTARLVGPAVDHVVNGETSIRVRVR